MSTSKTVTQTDLTNVLGSVSSSTPTAKKFARFDTAAHLNSTDMSDSDVNTLISDVIEGDGFSDIGQKNADLIAEDLTNTLTARSDYLSGTVKYDKVGDLVIVYVNGTTSAAISVNRYITNSALPSGYRPAVEENDIIRTVDGANLRVQTTGDIFIVPNGTTVTSGTTITGEVAYYV